MPKIYVTIARKTSLGYEWDVTEEQLQRLKDGDTLEGTVPDLCEQANFDFANLVDGDIVEDYAIEDDAGSKIQDWTES